MNRTWKAAIVIAIAVAMSSCTQPEAEAPQPEATEPQAAAEPSPAAEQPDPTVVDADHYKTEFENDRVRIVRVTYGPGEESVMHFHPAHVGVFLTEQHIELRSPDGTIQEVHGEAGQSIFVPAGLHQPSNTADQPIEVVVIELKSEAPGGAEAASEAGPDATVVDADHYKTEFENDLLRIVRINYGPGEESVMHYHPDIVAVFLTDHHVKFGFPDGSTEEVHANAGEHIVVPAGQHLPKNISDEPWEVVAVELK